MASFRPGDAGPQVIAAAAASSWFIGHLVPSVEWRRMGLVNRSMSSKTASLAALRLMKVRREMSSFLIVEKKPSTATLVRPSRSPASISVRRSQLRSVNAEAARPVTSRWPKPLLGHADRSLRSALASCRSAVSKPSENQP